MLCLRHGKQPVGMNLKESNRWVKKAQTIPWLEIEKRYAALFTNRKGNVAKQAQNGALNLAEIRHQNGHGDHMGRSLPQLCSDQPHATFTLRQTESALHFHALALIPIVLSLVSGFTLFRPSQSWAGKTDPTRLAIAEILPVSVDFVRRDPAGVMPLPRSEPLCHFPQISRLIVGVKRTALQPRPSVNDTDVQLRAKLHWLSRFSPHNGPAVSSSEQPYSA